MEKRSFPSILCPSCSLSCIDFSLCVSVNLCASVHMCMLNCSVCLYVGNQRICPGRWFRSSRENLLWKSRTTHSTAGNRHFFTHTHKIPLSAFRPFSLILSACTPLSPPMYLIERISEKSLIVTKLIKVVLILIALLTVTTGVWVRVYERDCDWERGGIH